MERQIAATEQHERWWVRIGPARPAARVWTVCRHLDMHACTLQTGDDDMPAYGRPALAHKSEVELFALTAPLSRRSAVRQECGAGDIAGT